MKMKPKKLITKLNSELAEAKEIIAKLEEDLKNKTDKSDMWYKSHCRLQDEINSIHVVLDGIQNCPGRTAEVKRSYGTDDVELGVIGRITGLMANMVHRQFPPNKIHTHIETDS
jgi:hypothetical protein